MTDAPTSESNWPPPLRIGPLSIAFPVIQAALSGYSDRPMRVLAQRMGAGATLAEVMLDKFIIEVSQGRKASRYVAVEPEDHPVGAQIMGSDPEQCAAAAVRLAELGFDFIDLNFGCPVPKVVGKHRGGYLLSKPKHALEIVARVRDALPEAIPLTVKMRRGMDDSPESRDRFFAIFDGAFALGAVAATVHGRYVRQRYEGDSSWEFLAEVKRHAGLRVVLGSGDLFSPEACMAMLRETRVDGLTIARGAIGNPWIFRQTRTLALEGRCPPPPSLHEQRELIREHFSMAEEIYGSRRAAAVMRKFGVRYAWLHPETEAVRMAFVRAKDRSEWFQVLETKYAEDRPGRFPPPGAHSGVGTPGGK